MEFVSGPMGTRGMSGLDPSTGQSEQLPDFLDHGIFLSPFVNHLCDITLDEPDQEPEDIPHAAFPHPQQFATGERSGNMSHNSLPRMLKFFRASNNLTQERLAEQLNVSTSLIAKFETARLIPMPDTAKAMDDLFGSGELLQETAAEVRKTTPPEWFRPWPDMEREASAIRWHEPTIIPGLLQTEAYSREILTSGLLTEAQAEEHVALRLERQVAVFERGSPPVCQFTIDQNALGQRGDPVVMKEQLHHLIGMGDRGRLFIHVIPHAAGHYPGENGPFMLASLPSSSTIGYVDDQVEGRLITEPGRVAALERSWQAVTAVALPCSQSRDLIMKLVNEL